MDPSSSVFKSTVRTTDESGRPYHVTHPSLTYTLTSVMKVLGITRFSPHEVRNTRIFVGEGATSTVFKTLVFNCMPILGITFGRRLVAVKQKRRKGSFIDSDIPLQSWLRTCYADLRIMGDEDLKSPNLMHVLGYYWEPLEIDGVPCLSPCLVMPLADCSLGDLFKGLVEEKTALILSAKVKLCAEITSGIHCLHSRGILHGDIKFDNVLIFQESEGIVAKISDFTHSIFFDDEHVTFPRYIGTRPYWQPEVRTRQHIERSSGNEPRPSCSELLSSDVYQLGVLMWRILNNGLEFVDMMRDAFMLASQEGENPFGQGIHLFVVEENIFDSTDSLLESLYCHPFMFLFLSKALVRYRLQGEDSAKVEGLCECLEMCLAFFPRERSPTTDILKKLRHLETGRSTGNEELDPAQPSLHYPFQEPLWYNELALQERLPYPFHEQILYNDLAFQELGYIIGQDESPVLCERLQTQIFSEISESAQCYSSGKPHLMLSICYALGFGTKFDPDKMLHHLREAALRGDIVAGLLLPRIYHVISGNMVPTDVFSRVETAVKDTYFGLVPELDRNLHLSLSGPAYYRERLRCRKVSFSDHRRISCQMGSCSSSESIWQNDQIDIATNYPELTSGLFLVSDSDIPTGKNGDLLLSRIGDALSREACGEMDAARPSQSTSTHDTFPEQTGQKATAVYDLAGFSHVYNKNSKGISPLLRACQLGQQSIVRTLLSRGVRANVADTFGLSPLHWASFFDDKDIEDICRSLVRAGASVDAATTKNLALVEHALMFQPGCTPIHFAVAMRNEKAVKVLLSMGANKKISAECAIAKNYYKMTALHFAICLHFYDIIPLLLDGEDPATVPFRTMPNSEYSNISILHLVSVPVMMRGSTAPFLPLLAHGIENKDAVQKTIQTVMSALPSAKRLDAIKHPLTTLSIEFGAEHDSLQALLRSGAALPDHNEEEEDCSSRLMDFSAQFFQSLSDGDFGNIALSSCDCLPSEQLLLAGVDGSSVRKSSPSVLDAIFNSIPVDLSQGNALYLLSTCADCDMDGPFRSLLSHFNAISRGFEMDDTFSLLKRATMNDSREILKLLLEDDPASSTGYWVRKVLPLPDDLHRREYKKGHTLTHLAAEMNAFGALNILLDHGADIDVCISDRGTPLAVAAERFSSRDAAITLLRRGANIYCNPEMGPGFSVLHAASEIPDIMLEGPQQFSMARSIVEAFPTKFTAEVINSQDNKGNTPLHCAARRCDLEMIKLLVELGCDIGAKDNKGTTALMFALISGTFDGLNIDKNLKVCGNVDNSENRTTWYVYQAYKVVRFLIEKGSPVPDIEPVSGEYTFLMGMACQLANGQTTKQAAVYCLSRLRFPNFSHPEQPAKIGTLARCQGPPFKFVAFDAVDPGRKVVFY